LGWPWVPPSEHIPRWESSFFYAMTGTLGELGVVSEGVGTPLPFEQIGAPWIDGPSLARDLEAANLAGVKFRPTVFRPRYGTYAGQFCQGVQIHLVNPHICQSGLVGETFLKTLARLYPERGLFKPSPTPPYEMFLKALGDSQLARALSGKGSFQAAQERSHAFTLDYLRRRQTLLIYQ
jgi:uncharacterized protein YbbC (DUF1343 family)